MWAPCNPIGLKAVTLGATGASSWGPRITAFRHYSGVTCLLMAFLRLQPAQARRAAGLALRSTLIPTQACVFAPQRFSTQRQGSGRWPWVPALGFFRLLPEQPPSLYGAAWPPVRAWTTLSREHTPHEPCLQQEEAAGGRSSLKNIAVSLDCAALPAARHQAHGTTQDLGVCRLHSAVLYRG